MCLAKKALGYEKEFNSTDYLGSSMFKSNIRLQAEKTYKDYGHGAEFPKEITDEVIKTFQIIGNNETIYGKSNPIKELMNEKSLELMDLENILLENGKKISDNAINGFKNNKDGINFISFNIGEESANARKILDENIKKAFINIIDRDQITK